jgi:hypothetical protein
MMADAIPYPAWFKPEEGAPPIRYLAEAAVPKGWIHVPGDYNVQTGQWVDPPTEDEEAPKVERKPRPPRVPRVKKAAPPKPRKPKKAP